MALSLLSVPPLLGQAPAKSGIPSEPKWPHAFELGAGEQTGFSFVVGAPGPIVVTVQWTGVPLLVSLAKPGGGAIEQQGTGLTTLKYNATAEDVKKGLLWQVSLRLAQEAPKPAGGLGPKLIDKPTRIDTRMLVKGSVAVQHPAGDMKRAQAEVKARTEQAQAQAQKPQAAATPPVDHLALRRAEHQKQQVARQAKLLEQVRPKLPVETYQKLYEVIAAPVAAQPGIMGLGGTQTVMNATAQRGPVLAKASAAADPGAKGIPGKGVPKLRTAAVGAAGGALPPTQPPPVVTSLSVSAGQPGDPLLIGGSGFSGDPGEVHFLVANGRDVPATVTFWADTQVVAVVPEVDGIPAYNGQLYVKRGTSKSILIPFRFNPATEYRTMGMATDKAISLEGLEPFVYPEKGYVYHPGEWWAFGAKGNDLFYLYARLKNGWTVDSAYLTDRNGQAITRLGRADAYIVELRQGTDSPYLNVRWWRDGGDNGVGYVPHIVISGPKGLPHQ
jgi:hypothetical protein